MFFNDKKVFYWYQTFQFCKKKIDVISNKKTKKFVVKKKEIFKI